MNIGDRVTWVQTWDKGFYANPEHEHRMTGTVKDIGKELIAVKVSDGRTFQILPADVRGVQP